MDIIDPNETRVVCAMSTMPISQAAKLRRTRSNVNHREARAVMRAFTSRWRTLANE